MNQTLSLQATLSSTNSFQDYEILKLNSDIVNAIARKIIERHQLPEAPLKFFSDGTNLVFAYGDHRPLRNC